MAGTRNEKATTRAIQIESAEGILLKIVFDEEGKANINISDKSSTLNFKATETQTEIIRTSFWDNFRRHNIWRSKAEKKETRRQAVLSSFDPETIKRAEEHWKNNPVCQDFTCVEWPDISLNDVNLL
jgi:hypothetical protein